MLALVLATVVEIHPAIVAAMIAAFSGVIIAVLNRGQKKRDELLVSTLTRLDETMVDIAGAVGALREGHENISKQIEHLEQRSNAHVMEDRRGWSYVGVPAAVLLGDTSPL